MAVLGGWGLGTGSLKEMWEGSRIAVGMRIPVLTTTVCVSTSRYLLYDSLSSAAALPPYAQYPDVAVLPGFLAGLWIPTDKTLRKRSIKYSMGYYLLILGL